MIREVGAEDVEIVLGGKMKCGETTRDILKFAKSEWKCCEVDISRFKDNLSALSSYCNAVKQNNIKTISAVRRNGKIYLVKKEVFE